MSLIVWSGASELLVCTFSTAIYQRLYLAYTPTREFYEAKFVPLLCIQTLYWLILALNFPQQYNR